MRTATQFARWLIGLVALALLLLGTANAVRSQPQRADNSPPAVLDKFTYLPLITTWSPTNDWLQFNGDPQHSGSPAAETQLTAGNVVSLTKLFQASLPDIADGAPVYLHAVSTTVGIKNVVYVTTKAGHIVALDANTGSIIWSKQNGGVQYTTSSPAIDPNHQFVYSYGLDGKVHKYQVGTGSEVLSGGWPETATFKPEVEKGSSPLTTATANGVSYLYAANGGYPGDAGDYQGHITAINLADGAQRVFNTMCSNQTVHFNYTNPDCPGRQSAIWARAAVVYLSDTNKIYMATGNGTFAPTSHDWGDTVFSLNPDGTGANGNPLNSYTPANYQSLQNADLDIGSTNIALLPTAITSTIRHLGVQSGKDALLRLIDLDTLSGPGGPGLTGGEVSSMAVPQGGEVLTAIAVWVDPLDESTWAFVADDHGISGLQVTYTGSHAPRLTTRWQNPQGGTSPIVVNSMVFYAGSNNLHALDPKTGHELWHDTTYVGGIHWESPIVVNGVVYITDENAHLTAFSR
jgi:outer membrane protein assembly factor BamB